MLIDTSHSPKYTGIVQSWTANAITVSGWVQVGNTGAGQVPPGTASAYVNPVTKIWALNANVASPQQLRDGGGGLRARREQQHRRVQLGHRHAEDVGL